MCLKVLLWRVLFASIVKLFSTEMFNGTDIEIGIDVVAKCKFTINHHFRLIIAFHSISLGVAINFHRFQFKKATNEGGRQGTNRKFSLDEFPGSLIVPTRHKRKRKRILVITSSLTSKKSFCSFTIEPGLIVSLPVAFPVQSPRINHRLPFLPNHFKSS